MSIASRITAMQEHLRDDYDVLTLAGADLTNVDKNIVNLKPTWKERLLYFMNNGTDDVWNNWNKVTGEGEEISLNNTLEAKMKIVLKGNTYQETTTGKNLFNSAISIWTGAGTGIYDISTQEFTFHRDIGGDYLIRNNSLSLKVNTGYTLYFDVSYNTMTNDLKFVNSSSALTGGSANTIVPSGQTGQFAVPLRTDSSLSATYDLWLYCNSTGTLKAKIMLVEGSYTTTTILPFEPYTNGASPNPDYPQDIHVVSGDNSIEVVGKNLFDEEFRQGDEISLTNTKTIFNKNDLVLKAGTYTFSCDLPMNTYKYAIGTRSTAFPGTIAWLGGGFQTTNQTFTFTISATLYIGILIAKKVESNITPSDFSTYKFQIEEGSATTYQPYQSASYPINLPVENLVEGIIEKENINSGGLLLIDNSFDMHIAKVVQGETYTITSNDINNGFVGGFFTSYPANNTYSYNNQRVVSNSWTFIAPITGYVVFRSLTGYQYAQLERGTKRNTYTPYGVQPIELCKIGTYQDKIFKNTPNTTDYDSNLEDNVWYVKKEIGKVVLDGSENWTQSGQATNTYRFALSQTLLQSSTEGYCNTNKFVTSGVSTDTELIGISGGTIYYRISTSLLTALDVTQFKNWLANNNSIVYAPLITPTYETITDTTLLSQLEALKPYSYNPVTNITQTNNDAPFELDVSLSYTNTMNVNNVGNIYAKPILTIEGSGTIGIILNDIEVLSVDLGTDEKITIDVPNLQAYNPDNDVLLNRNVTGDYMKLLINDGDNTIAFSGSVTSATLTNYTRWI